MPRGDLAGGGAGHSGVEGDPAAASIVTLLSSLVQEIVLLLFMYLAIIVPIFRRETFLHGLDHFLQTQLALAASLYELDEVATTSEGADVAQDRPDVVELWRQCR